MNDLNIIVPEDDTDLIRAGLLDSLALVDLLARVEREFALTIEFEDLDLESFRSIARLGDFIVLRRSAANREAPLPDPAAADGAT